MNIQIRLHFLILISLFSGSITAIELEEGVDEEVSATIQELLQLEGENPKITNEALEITKIGKCASSEMWSEIIRSSELEYDECFVVQRAKGNLIVEGIFLRKADDFIKLNNEYEYITITTR